MQTTGFASEVNTSGRWVSTNHSCFINI